MGLYIEPPSGSKLEWCNMQARWKYQSAPPPFELIEKDCLPVCCINNGPFWAAGVAVNKQEFKRFREGINGREAHWFAIPKVALIPVVPGAARLKEFK